MGRLWFGPDGRFGWLETDIWSSSQSQRVFDPYSFSWGQVMAGGTVIALPAILLFLIFRKQLVGGLLAGGVKG